MVTGRAPHVRDPMNLSTLRICLVAALLPSLLLVIYSAGQQAGLGLARAGLDTLPGWRGPLLAAIEPRWAAAAEIYRGMLYVLPILAVAVLTGLFWRWAFARLRRREFDGFPLSTALIFTLVVPPGAPLWQVALGMSFGIVVGKEIFGGTGKNFMNPALVGLAFLYLAYPRDPAAGPIWTGSSGYGGTTIFAEIAAGGMETSALGASVWWEAVIGIGPSAPVIGSAATSLMGAAVLLATGAASWRIMLAVTLGGALAALAANTFGHGAGPIYALPWYWHLILGGFPIGAVFLATEPVSAASTNPGRWIYGLLIGATIVLVRVANPAHPDGVLMAVLLGNVFAPLIDYGVVWANIRRRARRSV
ncbi:MAG: RnfABCDGE type electron transport complex subunit D [Paracoccaceae bacterium]|nr:RnfABCDGE type electron transport complex subunit D [Paracoccaceae bacterium]